MNRSSSTSRRAEHQRRRLLARLVIVSVSLGCIVWIGLVALSYAQWGRIEEIVITENPHIDIEQAEQEIQEALASHWPIMGNKDRHWTLPHKDIQNIVERQSNVIRSAAIRYREHTMMITTEIFSPAFITCFSDGGCGFTSNDGYVYDVSPEFSPGVYRVLKIMGNSPDYDHGLYQLPQEKMSILESIMLSENSSWGLPRQVVVDLLDVHIFFDTLDEVSIPEQAYVAISKKHVANYEEYLSERLRALQTKTNFFERLQSGEEYLEYLDLRFDEKMYMKFTKRGSS